MALTSNDMVRWLGSRQDSPTPDPDAVKLLQFLDTAALSIKTALEKSSNPKGKRLSKDNARACSRRRMMDGCISNANMSGTAGEKRRKLTTRQNADASFNSLFNIEPLIKPTEHQKGVKISKKNNKPSKFSKKSFLNRDLPVSFFVEPALRGRREISTDPSSFNTSYQSFNIDSSISPQSNDSHESRSRSPSLPEDTLESILDQGEINHLLSNHRWPHDVGTGSGACSLKSDSSATGYWVTGIDLTAATPSPQTFSESSLDSFYSTAPPMTTEWFQGVDLSPPTCPPGPCPYTLRNLASFENRISPFQFYGYPYGHGNNFEDTALVPRYQTHHEWDGRSNNNGTNAIHAAHYFNVRIAPISPLAIPQGFTSQCRHNHTSTESSFCKNPKTSNSFWTSP